MPYSKILTVFAHPLLERSVVNKKLLTSYNPEHIELVDLYEKYPNFLLPIEYEKELLEAHDIILLHHPLYWYSCPPLLKQWMDVVWEVGWAYGPGGNALKGKKIMQVITTGGSNHAYSYEGSNTGTIRTYLKPFEQAAKVCQMTYLPPFVIHGTHRLSRQDIEQYKLDFDVLLLRLRDENFIHQTFGSDSIINDSIYS
jgi:glutathione-regulated potassium-efflux system ancillary protein KefG